MNPALLLTLLFDGDGESPAIFPFTGLEYTATGRVHFFALGRIHYTADEGSIHYTAPAEDA